MSTSETGLRLGVGTLFSAWRRLAATPSSWPFVLAPAVLFLLLSVSFIYLILEHGRGVLLDALGSFTSRAWLKETLGWLGVALSSSLALLLALVLATPLSAPALEQLVSRTEAELGAAPRPKIGFFAEIWCGIRAQAAPLALTLPAWLVLFLLDVLVPILAPLTLILRALIAGLGIAWTLIDYPLTLRGVPIRKRLALFRRAPLAVLGLGAAFQLLFLIPGCGLFCLGFGVVAATELIHTLLAQDPTHRRELRN